MSLLVVCCNGLPLKPHSPQQQQLAKEGSRPLLPTAIVAATTYTVNGVACPDTVVPITNSADLAAATQRNTTYLIEPGEYVLESSLGSSGLAPSVQRCFIGRTDKRGDVIIRPDTSVTFLPFCVISTGTYTDLAMRGLTVDGLHHACLLEVSGGGNETLALRVENVDFISGFAKQYEGGAMYLLQCVATISNTRFINNTAPNAGAIVVITSNVPTGVTLDQVSE